MAKIKLIALDLDGTVFNEQKMITQRTRDAIVAAIRKGVVVIPATGRPQAGLPQSFLEIPGVRYALVSNGAAIVDLANEEYIYTDLLTPEDCLRILGLVPHDEVMSEFYVRGTGYTTKEKFALVDQYAPSPVYAEYIKKTRVTVESLEEFLKQDRPPVEKIHLLFLSMQTRQTMREQLEGLGDYLITTAVRNNLEINSATANKGNGILELGKILGIQQDEIMACGDGGNDFDMIAAAGLGVAMENADPRLKEIADFVTLSNEQDGVAVAIEKFVL